MLSQIASNIGGSAISLAFKSVLSFIPSFSFLTYFGFNRHSPILMNDRSPNKKTNIYDENNQFNKIVKNLNSDDENIFESAIKDFYNYVVSIDPEVFRAQFLEEVEANINSISNQEFFRVFNNLQNDLPQISPEAFQVKFKEYWSSKFLTNQELLVQKLQDNIKEIPDLTLQDRVKDATQMIKYQQNGTSKNDQDNQWFNLIMPSTICILSVSVLICCALRLEEIYRLRRQEQELQRVHPEEEFFENHLSFLSKTSSSSRSLAPHHLRHQISNLSQVSNISISGISNMEFESSEVNSTINTQGGDYSIGSSTLSTSQSGSQRRLLREGSDSSSFDLRTPSSSFMMRRGEEIETDSGNLSGGSQVHLIQR